MKQKVYVLAGSDRDLTKMAVDQYTSQLISKITNQPIVETTYKTLSANQFKQLVDGGEKIYLIDVRTEITVCRKPLTQCSEHTLQ